MTFNLNFDNLINTSGLAGLAATAASGISQSVATMEKLEQPNQNASPRLTAIKHRGYSYVDIETIPDESRRHLFGLDTPKEEKPEVNPAITDFADFMKKPIAHIKEIIDAHNPTDIWLESVDRWERDAKSPRAGVLNLVKAIRMERSVANDDTAKIKKMSVTPEYLKIVAIGIAHGDGEIEGVISSADYDDTGITEAEILEWFWWSIEDSSHLIGFNVIGFDLAAIMVRSSILGVRPSRVFDTTPWKGQILDLMLKRWPKGGQIGLKDCAKLYGIDVPAGDMDGSKTFETWKENPELVRDYVKSDVHVTRELHRKWSGFFC